MVRVEPVSETWLERAQRRMDELTKPLGALGYLEALGVRLAAIQKTLRPRLGPGAVVVAAADHGVAEEGVSAYPQAVTREMVGAFLRGQAAINQIAQAAEAEVYVLDVGVMGGDFPPHPRLLRRPVRPGTRNLAREPAMTREEAEGAIRAGMEAAQRALEEGATLLAAGDMGIGNTTAASALTAALLGLDPEAVTGRGTGLDEGGLRRKVQVVAQALGRAESRLGPLDQAHPLDLLAELGGLEIAAACGVFLKGAEAGVPLVTDGFPVTAGALLAARLVPEVKGYLFAGHLSEEPGHAHQLKALGLRPILNLGLRLGEGTGAVLAFPILRAAAAVMGGMATFEEAGVSRG